MSDLKVALIENGIECPVFIQVEPSGWSAGHGSCSIRDGESIFGMDVFDSNEDRDKQTARLAELPVPWCVAYGDRWSVTFAGDADAPDCEVVADRLGGEVKRSE